MEKNNSKVFFAQNLSDTLYQLDNTKNIVVLAGCSQADMTKTSETVPMPETSLIIRSVPELQTIDRHERFIDFGAAVTFSQILSETQHKLPPLLYETVSSIATPLVRNLATIGGNICCPNRKMTLYAPLLALDVRLELRSSEETISVPLTKFTGIPENSLLTKIRIPLDEWEVGIFKRVGPSNLITNESASFTFLADSQKSILTDLRISFCGVMCLRDRELENRLIGSRLPLSQKQIGSMIEAAGVAFDKVATVETDSILKDQFLNLLFYSLQQLA